MTRKNPKNTVPSPLSKGKESSEDDQKASLEIAQMRDKRMQNQATLVKLLQDLECDHFLRIMKGQMTVLKVK